MACALGRVQLGRVEEILDRRREAAERYDGLLADLDAVERPALVLPRRVISWFVYVVRLPEGVDRNRIQSRLADAGIATGRYFAPIHLQPAWRARAVETATGLKLTESLASRTLALPFFNRITAAQQERVVEALNLALR
jgi:perosamine synthetase